MIDGQRKKSQPAPFVSAETRFAVDFSRGNSELPPVLLFIITERSVYVRNTL